jgi:hypothetical protein
MVKIMEFEFHYERGLDIYIWEESTGVGEERKG